jgi:uncharacterized membrane protein
MVAIVLCVSLLVVFVFLFCREVRLDRERYLGQDRSGDEHIMREIEKFLCEKGEVNDRDS